MPVQAGGGGMTFRPQIERGYITPHSLHYVGAQRLHSTYSKTGKVDISFIHLCEQSIV